MALKQESKLIQVNIKEVLAGKSSTYEQLYRTHAGRIYTFGLKFYDHNKQAAEQLTKKVFIRGFEEINSYSENTTFILWLKKIATEEIRKGDIEKSEEIHQASIADEAVYALPEEERIVFILNDIEKHSVEEIIEITKNTEEEINAKLGNARNSVMEKLNVKSIDDLDYKINFVSVKPEPKEGLWEAVYNHIHKFATKDLKEEDEGEVLSIGDAKESLGEKYQKYKDEKKEKEIFLKPEGFKFPRKVILVFLLVVVISVAVWYLFLIKTPQWEVVNLSGSPTIKGDSKNVVVENSSILEKNDLLSTNKNSKALIKIAGVGEITINPGSSVERGGGKGEISITFGDIEIIKTEKSEPFSVNVFSVTIEDYKAGSYSVKVNENNSFVYSISAGLLITSGTREIYLLPEYICEIDQKSQLGIPYSKTASEELINAVNDFNLEKNNEALDIILVKSQESDALTLFNVLSIVDKNRRELVINKLHSLVRIPKDVNPHQVANLNKGDLKKWLKAIEEQN
ncbi:MAG TPA: hypothetical protein VLN45_09215 [Ignavibacteriaceae bacterium]|nr:hypothetical protein [Ignavibacteriaceae bacterium]